MIASRLLGQSLMIDTACTAEFMVDSILRGKGIRVGNVKLTGSSHSIGYFSIESDAIGMNNGLILSTGEVMQIAGENNSPGTSGIALGKSGRAKFKGDKDLNRLCKGKSMDYIILEFDFVPFNNNTSFNFSFASEEYREYVGSRFNDVFGFLVSGNGLRRKNIALIPGTSKPITINNLNHRAHKEYFVNNDYFLNFGVYKSGSNKPRYTWIKYMWNKLFHPDQLKNGFFVLSAEKAKLNQEIVSNFEFDGFTKVLTATCILEPWKLYHLKIAVGDVGDAIFDSGVFLEAESFISFRDTTAANFKDYPDLSQVMNWDSIFGYKNDTLQVIDEIFEVTNINFDFNQSEIPDTSKLQLDKLSKYLNLHQNLHLTIIGYTDNKGSRNYNLKLSEKRAQTVTSYLIDKGVSSDRIIDLGNSYDNPVGDNSLEDGRALNRRVELIIVED